MEFAIFHDVENPEDRNTLYLKVREINAVGFDDEGRTEIGIGEGYYTVQESLSQVLNILHNFKGE